MIKRPGVQWLASVLLVTLCVGTVSVLRAGRSARAADSTPAAAVPTNCKAYGAGKCCEPSVSAHLAKEAVFAACGESDATFLGEKGSKDTCRFVFKTDAKEEGFVEVYSPAQKEVPPAPNDPFFAWKRVGKVFVTDRALSPKSAPMLASATGLWMPGSGFFVSVNASTKICTKAEAMRLAKSIR